MLFKGRMVGPMQAGGIELLREQVAIVYRQVDHAPHLMD